MEEQYVDEIQIEEEEEEEAPPAKTVSTATFHQ